MMSRSSLISRLLRRLLSSVSVNHPYAPSLKSHPAPNPFSPLITRNYSSNSNNLSLNKSVAAVDRAVKGLSSQMGRDKMREKEQRLKVGLDTADIDAIDEDDRVGIDALIDSWAREKGDSSGNRYEEPTDSESDDDERFSADAVNKNMDQFEKKFKRHEELLDKFTKTETLDDAYSWMKRIDKFEEKDLRLRPEYRVIGELMNRLKVAEGKEKFLLQVKLNRAVRMVEWKEAFDPNDPANYGIIQDDQAGASVDQLEDSFEKEQRATQGEVDDDDLEFDGLKEKDTILLEKLNELDKKLEQKLAELDHTFGRKGRLLEEEIRDLAEERNSLTEQKRKPLYRKPSKLSPSQAREIQLRAMGFGALRFMIRPVTRILSPASRISQSSFSTTSSTELRRILSPLRRSLPWIPQSYAFHSLTDTRYPKRRPMDKPRRKRASLKPPGPYAWVKCVPGEPILPNQPNEGSVKRRNEKKRIKQRRAFIMSEKRKRKAQLQEATKKKLMKRVERKMAAVARDRAWAERLTELQRIEEEKKKAATV